MPIRVCQCRYLSNLSALPSWRAGNPLSHISKVPHSVTSSLPMQHLSHTVASVSVPSISDYCAKLNSRLSSVISPKVAGRCTIPSFIPTAISRLRGAATLCVAFRQRAGYLAHVCDSSAVSFIQCGPGQCCLVATAWCSQEPSASSLPHCSGVEAPLRAASGGGGCWWIWSCQCAAAQLAPAQCRATSFTWPSQACAIGPVNSSMHMHGQP